MLRVFAFAALLVGAGLLFGGALEEVAPVDPVAEASACDTPQKGCGSCWVSGDPLDGEMPRIECHN